jgi:hypothetical protein
MGMKNLSLRGFTDKKLFDIPSNYLSLPQDERARIAQEASVVGRRSTTQKFLTPTGKVFPSGAEEMVLKGVLEGGESMPISMSRANILQSKISGREQSVIDRMWNRVHEESYKNEAGIEVPMDALEQQRRRRVAQRTTEKIFSRYEPTTNIVAEQEQILKGSKTQYVAAQDQFTGQQVYTPTSRLNRYSKGIGIGIAGASIAGMAALDAYTRQSDVELTAGETKRLQGLTAFGGALSNIGMGVAAIAPHPYAKAAGAAAMGIGYGLDLGARAFYAFMPESEEAKRERGARTKRLKESTQSTEELVSTIADNRVGTIKDLTKASEFYDLINQDWKNTFESRIDELLASEKMDKGTARKLKSNLPKVARGLVEGFTKIQGDNVKQFLIDNEVATASELEKVDENQLASLISATKMKYIKETRPNASVLMKQQEQMALRGAMSEIPYLNNLGGTENALGLNLQQFQTNKQNLVNNQFQKLEKALTVDLYNKGGRTDWDAASKRAQDMVSEMKTRTDIEGSFTRLLQYTSLPNEKFVKDKVYDFREKSKEVFSPDMMTLTGGFENSIKGYMGVLHDTMSKTLLFNTQPSKTFEAQLMQENRLNPMTPEQLQTRRNDYIGVMPTVFSQMAQTAPTFLSGQVLGALSNFQMQETGKAFDTAVKEFSNIDTRAKGFLADYKSIQGDLENLGVKDFETAKKAGIKASKTLVDSVMEGLVQEVPVGTAEGGSASYTITGPKAGKWGEEETRKRLDAALKASAETKNWEYFTQIAEEAGNTKIGKAGQETEYGKAAKGVWESYNMARRAQWMYESPDMKFAPGQATDEQLLSVIKRNLSIESATKLSALAPMNAQAYQQAFANVANIAQYSIGAQKEFLGGGYSEGGGSKYAFINGQLMKTSFMLGGQEHANMFYTDELEKQRQKQQLSEGAMTQISALGSAQSAQSVDRIRGIVDKLEFWRDSGAAPPTIETQKTLDLAMAQAKATNTTIPQDILDRVGVLRQQAVNNAGDLLDKYVMPKFMEGKTEEANQMAAKLGIGDELRARTGESPMEKAVTGMSGIGDAISVISAASKNLGSSLEGAGKSAATAVDGVISELDRLSEKLKSFQPGGTGTSGEKTPTAPPPPAVSTSGQEAAKTEQSSVLGAAYQATKGMNPLVGGILDAMG